MRKLWIILSSFGLLLIIALVVVYFTINFLARAGVEEGGKWALGVDTHVASAGVSLMRGRLSLDDVTVDNPAGYRSALFFRSIRTDIDVKRASLLTRVLEIPRVEVEGIEINMEAKPGSSNVGDIMNHVRSLASGTKKDTGNRQVKIDTIALKNITAKVQLLTSGGGMSDITIQLSEIDLHDVSGEGATVGDVIAQVLPAIMAGVLAKGKEQIPAEFANQLGADVVGAAKALGAGALKLLGQIGGFVGDVGEGIGNMMHPSEKDGAGIGKDIGEGLAVPKADNAGK